MSRLRPIIPYATRAAEARKALLAERARCMRFAPTATEALLWSRLRARQLGVQFRRQYVVGRFIADFAAPAVRLVVEVDGAYHARRCAPDARRDDALRRAGWRVLRVPAALVEQRLEEAALLVRAALLA